MNVWHIIASRMLHSVAVLFLVTLVMFFLMHLVPGDPIDAIVGERQGDNPEMRERIERLYGLDRPLPLQYFYYARSVIRGDLGMSVSTGQPVATELRSAVPATFELAFASMVMALAVGVPLGVFAAVRKDQWPDKLARLIAVSGASIPIFWLALILAYVFAFQLQWLPRSGRLDVGMEHPPTVTGFMSIDALLAGELSVFTSFVRHLLMPAAVLSIYSLGIITRMLRSSLVEALGEDYVRTARAKGLTNRSVIATHALRNAVIPSITVIGLTFSGLLTGAAIVERVFAWPGMGDFAVRMAFNSDYPGLLGVTLVVAIIFITVNLVVDLVYTLIDPRIRGS